MIEFNPLDILATAAALKRCDSDDGTSDTPEASSSDNNGNENQSEQNTSDNPDTSCNTLGSVIEVNKMLNEHSYGHSKRNLKCISLYETSMGKSHTITQDSIREGIQPDSSQQNNLVCADNVGQGTTESLAKLGDNVDMIRDNFLANVTHNMCVSDNLPEVESMEMDSEHEEAQTSVIKLENVAKVSTEAQNSSLDIGITDISGTFINDEDLFFVSNVCESDSDSDKITHECEEQTRGENCGVNASNFQTTSPSPITPDLLTQQTVSLVKCEHSCPDIIASHCNEMDSIDVDKFCAKDTTSDTLYADSDVVYFSSDTDNKAASAVKTTDTKHFVDSAERCGNGHCLIVTKQCSSNERENIKNESEIFLNEKLSANLEKIIHESGNDVNIFKDRHTLKLDSFTDIKGNPKVIDNVHPEKLPHEHVDENIDIDILTKDKVSVKKSDDCYRGQFCSDHSYASLLPRDSSRLGDNCDNFDADSERPSTSSCRDATLLEEYRSKENTSEVGDVAPAVSIADDSSSLTKSCRDDCSDSNMSFSTLSDDFSGYSPSSPSTCSPVQTVPVYHTPTKDTTANSLLLSKSNSPRYGKFQIGTFASFSNSEIGLEESNVTRKIFAPPCGPNDTDSCDQKTPILASGSLDAIRNVGDSFLSCTASHPASALVVDPSHILHDHDYCSHGNPPSSALSPNSIQQEYLASSVGANEKKHTKRPADGRGKRTIRKRHSNASLSKSSDDMEIKSEVMAEDSFDELETSLDLEDSVRKASTRHMSDALPTRASRREPKMKITGSFQDDYVYFLNKKNRNRRRASCDPPMDSKVIPIKNAADIVIPHLSDADLELLKGQLSSARKSAHFSNYVGGASMQAASISQSVEGTTDADDAHLINTILSMESTSKNEDANVPYDAPASSSLIGAESFGGLNLTPEQMNVLMNAMALAQNDFGNFEDSATASLASCDEDLSPTDSISPLNNIDKPVSDMSFNQQANPVKDLDKPASDKSQAFDFDEGFGMGVSSMDMMFDGGRPVESIPKEPSVEYPGNADEGNKIELEASSARTRPIAISESPTKTLLQTDIPSISNPPVPINPLSDFSNLDRQFDILGGEFKLDKEDLFPEATVAAPETSTATVPSLASEYNAPWIVTVTMYWNDLPAIMMNNRPYLRLVDIHKQVLPAKDTGILKKRCQLLGLEVQNCSELQRYFLVQYGKAYNSKSTLVITKDDAKKLIGYYVEPQPKVPRADLHEHRNGFTNREKSHGRSGKFRKRIPSPLAPVPVVVGSSNDVSTSTNASELISNSIESAEDNIDSNDRVPVPDKKHVPPVNQQLETTNSGRENLRHNVAQTEVTTSSSDDESQVALEKKSRVVEKETIKESAKMITPLAPIPAVRNVSTGTMSRLRHKKINFLEMLRGGTVSMDSDGDVENGVPDVDKTKGEHDNDENIPRSRHGRRPNLSENDTFTEVLCERSSKRATKDIIHGDDLTEVNIANITRGPRKRRSAESYDNARETVVNSEVPTVTHMSQSRRLNAFKLRIKACRRTINKGEENKRNSLHRKKAMSKLSVKSSRFIAICHGDSHRKNGTRNNIQNGDLYFNLFDQKNSPCIRCSTCRKYLSVDGFLCHIHEHGSTGKTTATNPSQVLELRNGDMSRFVMKQWELFQKKKVLFDNNQLREDGIDSAALKMAENEMNEGIRLLCKQQRNPSMRISSRVRKQKQLYPIENYAYANSAKRGNTDSDIADEVDIASGTNEGFCGPSPTKLIKLGSKILGNIDSPTKCSPLGGISESNVVALQNGPELMTFTALERNGEL